MDLTRTAQLCKGHPCKHYFTCCINPMKILSWERIGWAATLSIKIYKQTKKNLHNSVKRKSETSGFKEISELCFVILSSEFASLLQGLLVASRWTLHQICRWDYSAKCRRPTKQNVADRNKCHSLCQILYNQINNYMYMYLFIYNNWLVSFLFNQKNAC